MVILSLKFVSDLLVENGNRKLLFFSTSVNF